MSEFIYKPLFSLGKDSTQYTKLDIDGVEVEKIGSHEFLKVKPHIITKLISTALYEVNHYLRATHLQSLQRILLDDESSKNDKFVAQELLKNASIAAKGKLPSCQDTGTAIIMGKKGQFVLTEGDDAEIIARGVYDIYKKANLRYSQVAALTMYDEKNTGTNLPAQIDIYSNQGNEYHFLILAKGGGSANKTFLYQKTKALLNEESLLNFVREKIFDLGTAACPPYHLAFVVGGTSAEANLKTVKLASTGYLDNLPEIGDMSGRAFRDKQLEEQILKITREIGIGAQFGGKYFCHDVRVIRLARHGASCPVGLGVSCSADRNIKAKISKDGVFLEQLEHNPERYYLDNEENSQDVIQVDLTQPITDSLKLLSGKAPMTRVSLTGDIIVARDMAHAKLNDILNETGQLPQYFKDHLIYYAGPSKTPEGFISGSFGPTTAQRMDSYVEPFQRVGASLIMLAKGNRTSQVREACKKYGGVYLGSIGGPAARLGQDFIRKVEVLAFKELGMEAIWKISVENFPAFIIINDKGQDFFERK